MFNSPVEPDSEELPSSRALIMNDFSPFINYNKNFSKQLMQLYTHGSAPSESRGNPADAPRNLQQQLPFNQWHGQCNDELLRQALATFFERIFPPAVRTLGA